MKLLSTWVRKYVHDVPVDDRTLASDLTLRGIAVEGIEPVADATAGGSVFEMDITTNRVDAMNHYGVAREAAVIYGLPLTRLWRMLPGRSMNASAGIAIEVAEPDLCGRFTAQMVRGVTVKPASGRVAERFAALGEKPINNIVDASNYVLLAMGHPTHAFDANKIRGGKIVVRKARAGEKLKTLDGVERTLAADDLVIADAERAISIAGVMGGWETMITPETKNILIEAAWFEPATVRRSARRHLLFTDASHRFERGADFAAAPVAQEIVAEIVLRDGGELVGEITDWKSAEWERRTVGRDAVTLRMSEVARILGATRNEAPKLDAAMVERTLTALGCEVSERGGGAFAVKLPSWRLDLAREIDLIEEVARVYGYNNFADTLPAFAGVVTVDAKAEKAARVRETMLAAGFSEAISSTFAGAADGEVFAEWTGVALGNPLSEEAGVLRPGLAAGMVGMLAHNLNYGAANVRLFEMGTVFSGDASGVKERQSLAFGMTGAVDGGAGLYAKDDAAFYAMKGAVEAMLRLFVTDSVAIDGEKIPKWLHYRRSARIVVDGKAVGWFGQLHPSVAEARKLRQPVWVGELDVERLLEHELRTVAAREVSRFQVVERDFSFTMDDKVEWAQVAKTLDEARVPAMTGYAPAEIFRGKNAGGKYSLLLRVTLQAADHTLSEEELQSASEKIIAAVSALGGELRK